jgi:hypothetical protein
MAYSEHLQNKMGKALAELEARLRADNRVAIGEARWEPDLYRLVVDSVPVNTVKLLGQARVLELYEQAKRETERAERAD